MIAAKHFDMVVGVDVHIIMIPTPGGPVPTPLPHPFVGMMFDPDDYDLAAEMANLGLDIQPILDVKNIIDDSIAKINPATHLNNLIEKAKGFAMEQLGINPPPSGKPATVKINGLPRSHIGSKGKAMPPHIPMGGPFQTPPDNDCEAFLGSMTVDAEGEHLCFLGCMAQSCQDIPKFPNSSIIAVPKGLPVLVGGAPVPAMPSLNQLMLKAFNRAMSAIKNSKMVKGVSKRIHNAAKKGMDKLKIPADSFIRDKVRDNICEVTGHPIVIATGKVYTEQLDFKLPGLVPLQWKRKWKSTSRYQGPFGYGWHHSYDLALTIEDDVTVVRMADGRPVVFPPITIGDSFTNLHENLTLKRTSEAFVLRGDDNLNFQFQLKDQHKGIILLSAISGDGGGQEIQFYYDNDGHLNKILDASERELRVETTSQGLITKIEAPHPEKKAKYFTLVSYRYDPQGHLVECLDSYQNAFSYEYEGHLLVKETNRNGLSFYFQYDGDDDRARCIHTWGDGGIYDHKLIYNLVEKWTTVENSLGHISKYFWNDKGLNWKITNPLGHSRFKRYTSHAKIASEIDELGHITSYSYNDSGQRTETVFPDGTSIMLNYQDGLLSMATDQNGNSWMWEYNEDGQLVSRTDPTGAVTQYQYKNGLLSEIIDAAGGRSILTYNDQKLLSSWTTPDGATSRWKYDLLGRSTEIIDPRENVQYRKYDFKGRIQHVREPDGNRRDFKYDPNGNMIRVKDKHHDVRFEYGQMNRLKARVEDGTRVEFKYDTEGNLLGIINEHGYAYRFQLDPNFRVLEESGFDGIMRRYKRNEVGRVTEVKRASSIITKYNYDVQGRVTGINHSDGAWEKFDYREDGALIEATNNAITIKFERDAKGRILKEMQGSFVIESQYNEIGLRTKVESSLGANLFFGRNIMGDVQQVTSENESGINWEASFRRDHLGLETERLLPGDVRSQWKRDQLGRPIEQKTFAGGGEPDQSRKYVWDVNSRLKQIIDDKQGVTQFEHDVSGNLSAATYGDGSKEFRTPDAVGNLFRRPNQKDRKYGPAGQLLEAEGTRYKYDPEGNLIKKIEPNGATWYYHWSATGMLRKVTRPDGADVSFTYDALGRRISKSYRGKRTRWVWDGNIMLHEWVESYTPAKSSENKITLKSRGKIKIRRRDEQIVTAPANAPPLKEEIESLDLQPSFDEVTTWVFEPGRFAPLAKLNGLENFSIVSDHLGTPMRMYNDEGQKVWEMDLSIYGEVRDMDGQREDCPFRYPGQYEDVETGLYYNRFRYYDQESGSYICQDPIGLLGGLKIYNYVDDPNLWVDVFGLTGGCEADAELDWTKPEGPNSPHDDRHEHVNAHGVDNLNRSKHGVFNTDPIQTTEEAWRIANRDGINPTRQNNGKDAYIVPMENVGYEGGHSGSGENVDHVLIITDPASSTIVTAYPIKA